jgi:hypothetical protein
VRTATLTRTSRGPSPLPRRRINQPAFREAVRSFGQPGRRIAYEAGLNYRSELSKLICATSVPDTPLQIERLERVAMIVGFDRDQLFVEGGQ